MLTTYKTTNALSCMNTKYIQLQRGIFQLCGKNIPNLYFLQAEGQVGYVPHINLLGEAED